MSFWNRLKALFTGESEAKIHSFTYFIPAPPKRQSGYREKQFDKVFFEFINQGYEILSVHTQSLSITGQAGMWVLITVKECRKLTRKETQTEDFSFEGRVTAAILEDENLDLRESLPIETTDHSVLEGDGSQMTLEADAGPGENEQVEGLYFIKNHKN